MLVPTIYAQAVPSGYDPITALTQIGIGALIAIPFIVTDRIKAKRIDELEEKIGVLVDARIEDARAATAREVQLSHEVYPVVTQAAQVLSAVQQSLRTTVETSRERPAELDRVIRRAELLTDELSRVVDRGGDGG